MRLSVTLLFLLLVSFASAQFAPLEIKKNKISKILILSTTAGSTDKTITEIRYDEKGNDTASYINNDQYERREHIYDAKDKLIKSITYTKDGRETYSTGYVYNKDGSYTVNDTFKVYGAIVETTYYDNQGRKTKTISTDGKEKLYTYDSHGRLLRLQSTSGNNGGEKEDIYYSYDSKGQLIGEKNNGDYKYNKTFTWNARGLLDKEKFVSIINGVPGLESIHAYEYEFRQ